MERAKNVSSVIPLSTCSLSTHCNAVMRHLTRQVRDQLCDVHGVHATHGTRPALSRGSQVLKADCCMVKSTWVWDLGLRKLGVPYSGLLIIRILLFRVQYYMIRVPYFRKLPFGLPAFSRRIHLSGVSTIRSDRVDFSSKA